MQKETMLGLFNEIEQVLPVAEWRFGDVRIWPLVRHELSWMLGDVLAAQLGPPGASGFVVLGRGRSVARGLVDWARATLVDARHNASSRRSADVVLLGNNRARVWVADSWYDRLCEPVIESLEARGLHTLHLEANHHYPTPRHNATKLVRPRLDVAWVRSRMQSPQVERLNVPGHDRLLAMLPPGSVAVRGVQRSVIARQAAVLEARARYFEKVMRRVGAACGVLVDYALTQMAFHLACHRVGIPSVEISHGVENRFHANYARWIGVPAEGYELLPSLYWVWTNAGVDVIEQWADGIRHRVVRGGNPWIKHWRAGDGLHVRESDREVKPLRNPSPEAIHVLVTLQTGMTSDRYLGEVLRAHDAAPDTWRWWFRQHPAMPDDEVRSVENMLARRGYPAEELRQVGRLPLYALLRHSDVHVTTFSSSLVEARMLGVPSVITLDAPEIVDRSELEEYFQDEFRAGWAILAKTQGQILAAIQDLAARRDSLPRMDEVDPDPAQVLFDVAPSLRMRASRAS